MKMGKESYQEGMACKKAKVLGWHNRKLDTVAGDPDRMFFKQGVAVLIEFKQRGKKPTALQLDAIKEWQDAGFPTTWVDDWRGAIGFLEEHDPSPLL
jgi:hypothetical protein